MYYPKPCQRCGKNVSYAAIMEAYLCHYCAYTEHQPITPDMYRVIPSPSERCKAEEETAEAALEVTQEVTLEVETKGGRRQLPEKTQQPDTRDMAAFSAAVRRKANIEPKAG